jgi:hypothetical protein
MGYHNHLLQNSREKEKDHIEIKKTAKVVFSCDIQLPVI